MQQDLFIQGVTSPGDLLCWKKITLFSRNFVDERPQGTLLMGLSFPKYLEWLDKRNLNWPKPPPLKQVKAKPFIRPLRGIRAVCWEPYGTLLRMSHGELLHETPEPILLQIALDKTIQEFNMWNSMIRKAGDPWEVMLPQYQSYREDLLMVSVPAGETPAIDSTRIWKRIIEKLMEKEYRFDESFQGDLEEFSQKVAYFFHASLQGVEAAPLASKVIQHLSKVGIRQGVVGNGQKFTVPQMLRLLNRQSKLSAKSEALSASLMTLSVDVGVRTPSASLFKQACNGFLNEGINPSEVLYVGSHLREGLVPAKAVGFRTALYAGDENSLCASKEDLRNQDFKPDRLITKLNQLLQIIVSRS